MDGFDPGIYNCTIIIYDEFGNYAIDTIYFTVEGQIVNEYAKLIPIVTIILLSATLSLLMVNRKK